MNLLIDDETIMLARKLEGTINDIGVQLQKIVDWASENCYQDYKRSRTNNPMLTPEFFVGIYKREDIEKFEARLKMEKSI